MRPKNFTLIFAGEIVSIYQGVGSRQIIEIEFALTKLLQKGKACNSFAALCAKSLTSELMTSCQTVV